MAREAPPLRSARTRLLKHTENLLVESKLESIREITTKLSSNEFERRDVSQSGADKTAVYLAGL